MDWELLYTFTSCADEPREGEELDWEEARVHGEKVVPEVDRDQPAAPRAALRHYPVVKGTVSAVAAPDYTRLTVADVTDEPVWRIPAPTELYVDRKGGKDADRVYVYVNPALAGGEVYVQYEYHPTGEAPGVCVSGSLVYWTGPDAGSWFVYDGEEVSRSYQAPSVRDVAASVDGVYGAGPDLHMFSRRLSMTLGSFPGKVKPKETVGYLAQAWAATVDYTPGRIFRFGSGGGLTHEVRPGEEISYGIRERRWVIPSIEVSYPGGRARFGDEPGTVRYSNPRIESLAHARSVAGRIYRQYEEERAVFEINIAGVRDIRPGDRVEFPVGCETDANLLGTVRKVRINFGTVVTGLELVLVDGERKLR